VAGTNLDTVFTTAATNNAPITIMPKDFFLHFRWKILKFHLMHRARIVFVNSFTDFYQNPFLMPLAIRTPRISRFPAILG